MEEPDGFLLRRLQEEEKLRRVQCDHDQKDDYDPDYPWPALWKDVTLSQEDAEAMLKNHEYAINPNGYQLY